MSQSKHRAAVELDEPLPSCAGPRLRPFPNRRAEIRFVSLLSEDDPGNDGHVFEVDIGSKLYALKMFKFYDSSEHRFSIMDEQNDIVTDEILEGHMDPFYAECRAFGRIEERGLNGKMAVRCYGFMAVPAFYEDYLIRKFRVDQWNRPAEEYFTKSSKRQPFRAIVKELIRENTGLTDKIGVYTMDVRAPNFKNGRLIDFSVSYTEPHFMFQIRPRWQVNRLKRRDLLRFDKMVRDEKIHTWQRMMRNEDYCSKLRQPKQLVKSRL